MRSGCEIPAGGDGRSDSRSESPGIAEVVSELPIVPLHAPNERRNGELAPLTPPPPRP